MTGGALKQEALLKADTDGGLFGLTSALLRAVREALDGRDERH